ncbi:hydantoinase B/oxoprolinase family protein [Mesorhizobium sp. M0910]|uniref:hydantoinase B/oxoprolinase family protein n=1 Tax=Mesorhizobium sp. M0910 TaxID=2957025 RepID=UPI00333A90BB
MNKQIEKMGADPVTTEITRNALTVIAEQITTRMIRSATSHIIREMEDCSAAIFDARGRLLAESASVPIHLNAINVCLDTILQHYFPISEWKPGDVIITNDPYAGGASLSSHHTNDIITYRPVFLGDRLVSIVAITVHHMDVAAAEMGTRGWNTEIEQEGLRVPPVKIIRSCKLDQGIFSIFKANTRLPEYFENDLMAQLSTLERAETEIIGLFEKYGVEMIENCFDNLIAHSEVLMREYIRSIPDGEYSHEEVILDDGAKGGPFKLRLTIRVNGSDIQFDFTGTDKQVAGPINAPLSATMAAIGYVMRSITNPDLPNTEGTKRPVSVVALAGTLVNCQWPAACTQRMVVCHVIVDLVMGALAEAIPERVMADSCGCLYNGVTCEDESPGKRMIVLEVVPGGIGATSQKDGANVLSCHVTNCPIPPIEATESDMPILFLKRELYQDSGGAGRYRGGLGQVLSYKVLSDVADLHYTSQKSVIHPQGTAGGGSGDGGHWMINEGSGSTERRLKYAIGDLEPLQRGDVVTHYTPGGGGYGRPHDRPVAEVVADVREGYISINHASEFYGVVIDPKTLKVTEVRRA